MTDDTLDNEVSDEHIHRIRFPQNLPYFKLAKYLRVSPSVIPGGLEALYLGSQRSPELYMHMIEKWKRTNEGRATYRALFTALMECDSHPIVKQLCELLAQ